MNDEEKIEDQPNDDCPLPTENENISEPSTISEQPSTEKYGSTQTPTPRNA